MLIKEKKLDANEQIYFNQELTKVLKTMYEVVYPELKAVSLIPVSFELGPAARTWLYKMYEGVGFAKIIHNYAKDFPRVSVKAKEFSGIIKALGDSYGWSVQDIREAAMTGFPLQTIEANNAKRAIKKLENDIAFFGDADNNLPGFLTNLNIPSGTVPADGQGNSTLWTSKTPDLILRDMNLAISAPFENTNGVEFANTLLLPPAQYKVVNNTPFSPLGDRTILEWFVAKGGGITVDWANELKAANNPMSKDIMIAYNKNPTKVQLHIPLDFEQFPPQEEGLEYVIYCHERIAGVVWHYPMSAAIYDGI